MWHKQFRFIIMNILVKRGVFVVFLQHCKTKIKSTSQIYSKVKNGDTVQRASWTKTSVLRLTWSLMKVKSCRVGPTKPSVGFTYTDTIRQKKKKCHLHEQAFSFFVVQRIASIWFLLSCTHSFLTWRYSGGLLTAYIHKHHPEYGRYTHATQQQHEIWDVYTVSYILYILI